MSREQENHYGIFTDPNESSFKSIEEIQLEAMQDSEVSVNYPNRKVVELTFEELHDEMLRRSEIRKSVEAREFERTIEIHTDQPIGWIWWADVHSGNSEVDYERLKYEADIIKNHPYLKVGLGGDFADAFCFNPAQYGDIANLSEQKLYFKRLLDYIGYNKVLFAIVGNHEKWSRKTGFDMYDDIRAQIPVFDGVGTVHLKVNDILYDGAVMHKAKGYSYFNPNHPQKRFVMENEGYRWVATAHTHTGSEQSQPRSTIGGNKKVVFLTGKTLKTGDDFLDTQGNKRMSGDAIGSNGIIFNHDKFMMRPMSSIEEMIETLDH